MTLLFVVLGTLFPLVFAVGRVAADPIGSYRNAPSFPRRDVKLGNTLLTLPEPLFVFSLYVLLTLVYPPAFDLVWNSTMTFAQFAADPSQPRLHQ